MFKICSMCEQAKHISEYNLRRGNQPQGYCKECNKSYKKDMYKSNPLERIRLKVSNRTIKMDKRSITSRAKDKPCADCNRRFPSHAMDFDHVRGEKSFTISHGIKNKTVEEILAEIEKCDVVCATCHRMRTQDRIRGRKTHDGAIQAPTENS